MDVFYWESAEGNFGDDLNLWLWDALLPGWRDWRDDTVLVGAGTILNARLLPNDRRKLVIGSGVGYGAPPVPEPAHMWDVRCVRGPRTARALGLDAGMAGVDPAMLIADLPGFRDAPKTGEALFVPHFRTVGRADWPTLCARAELTFVSPSGDAAAVIRRIAGARLVVAESMHAAIMADAFRVPWVPVALTPAFNDFKWRDWAESLDLELDVLRFRDPAQRLRALLGRGRPAGAAEGTETGPKAAGAEAAGRVRGGGVRGPLAGRLGALNRRAAAMIAPAFLRRAAARPPHLSSPEALDRAKGRLRAAIETIRADYAPGGRLARAGAARP